MRKVKDKTHLIGKIFNQLKIIEIIDGTTLKSKRWFVKCCCTVCNNVKTTDGKRVENGFVKCNYCSNNSKTEKAKNKLIGIKVNKVTIISIVNHSVHLPLAKSYFNVLCECGNTKNVSYLSLFRNKIKSCGCLNILTKEESIMASAKRVHKVRYSDGNLSFEDFFEMSQKNCTYCGDAPFSKYNCSSKSNKVAKNFTRDEGSFIYNGLDRVDSFIPHNKDNLVTCCKICNFMKSNLSVQEFDNKIISIYNKFIKGDNG